MFLAISPTLDTRNLDREPSVHFLSLLGSCSRRVRRRLSLHFTF
ncbi:hypothetical protein CLIM01_09993 [Colletotrichum limetticola]|uniref:Uncharacterized protein n=1 Tax=Colletotrichum limetticola TaxID=1209924 RepID=A0ABQ9PLX5_9PEZI|nr:hypothetical protein CLIM01_09993 [Colletotrichum limetticola]